MKLVMTLFFIVVLVGCQENEKETESIDVDFSIVPELIEAPSVNTVDVFSGGSFAINTSSKDEVFSALVRITGDNTWSISNRAFEGRGGFEIEAIVGCRVATGVYYPSISLFGNDPPGVYSHSLYEPDLTSEPYMLKWTKTVEDAAGQQHRIVVSTDFLAPLLNVSQIYEEEEVNLVLQINSVTPHESLLSIDYNVTNMGNRKASDFVVEFWLPKQRNKWDPYDNDSTYFDGGLCIPKNETVSSSVILRKRNESGVVRGRILVLGMDGKPNYVSNQELEYPW